jgi:hypothetical protein
MKILIEYLLISFIITLGIKIGCSKKPKIIIKERKKNI